MLKFTIFTPTYNRKNKLNNLYQSLRKQSFFNFEWLIIDDGSLDDTKELVDSFKEEKNQFDIVYIYQQNSGKHVAYNNALEHARGEYFICVDSDDILANDVLIKIKNIIDLNRYQFCYIAYKVDKDGNLLSDRFPEGVSFSSKINLEKEYNCRGEFSFIYPLVIAKKYKFPVYNKEKFITEDVIYDRIDLKYKYNILNLIVSICEYQSDGYTSNLNSIMKKNPLGYCLYFCQRIDLQNSFIDKLIFAGKYRCFCFFAKNKLKNEKIKYTGSNKILVKFSLSLAFIFYIYYKIFRGF